MKGSPKVLEHLNKAVTSELQAIQQYKLHAALADNQGFPALAKSFDDLAAKEAEHLKELMDRITFLEGVPVMGLAVEVRPATGPQALFQFNQTLELGAVALYQAGVELCVAEGDETTRALLSHILGEEQEHVNYIETELRKVKGIGAPYLAELAESN